VVHLQVAGAPAGATVFIDGQPQAASTPIAIPPGRHHVRVTASGMRPWQGPLTLTAGPTRVLRVHLAPERRGPRPGWFWSSLAATGALTAGALATGYLAIRTQDEYSGLVRGDPRADELSGRGRALSLAADSLGIAAIGAALLATWLFVRTDFVPGTSTAEIDVVPCPAR
jgi:hypothetical protein